MILYLAGGVSGNLKPAWKIAAQLVGKMQYEKAWEAACKYFLQVESGGIGSSNGGRKTKSTEIPKEATEPG